MTDLESTLLEGLNPEQIAVVKHGLGPMLVAAVPGSGKTRSVVHRMAYLNLVCGVRADKIFGITFTKKAAQEMTERVTKLIGHQAVQVQTFHAFCRRVLAEEMPNFDKWELGDDGSYRTLVKKALDYEHMNWETADVEEICSFIELAKAAALWPSSEEELLALAKPCMQPRSKVIEAYSVAEELRIASGVMTFADWMMETYKIFRDDEYARKRWAGMFEYIMVDEAQDNSDIQAMLVEQLGRDHRNVMLIGDENQSLYAFRGAKPELFVNFPKTWESPTIFMLRNYRSGTSIIALANDTLASMSKENRVGEGQIVAERASVGEVTVCGFPTDDQEAERVVQTIQSLHDDGQPYVHSVVLYRTNAMSRPIESALINAKVPYHIVGSTFFYARREVATLIAYLRVAWRIGATQDDVQRCLFSPRRYLGKAFMRSIDAAGKQKPQSFSHLVEIAISHSNLKRSNQIRSARDWAELIDSLRADIGTGGGKASPGSLIQKVVERTGFEQWLRRDEGKEAPDNDRNANVLELISVASKFSSPGEFLSHVRIQHAAFLAAKDEAPLDRVTLMSIHRSKALEWPSVFLVQCVNGKLPHHYASDIEEERRIFYVGVTRARDLLQISYSSTNSMNGFGQEPSCFLKKHMRELQQGSDNYDSDLDDEEDEIPPELWDSNEDEDTE